MDMPASQLERKVAVPSPGKEECHAGENPG